MPNRFMNFLAPVTVAAITIGMAPNARAEEPFISRDWVAELNELRASLEPDGEPAWPLYRDAIINEFGVSSGADDAWSDLRYRLKDLLRRRSISMDLWDERYTEEAEQIVVAASKMFEALDAAAKRPRMGKPYTRVGDALLGEKAPNERRAIPVPRLPEVVHLRAIGQLNALRLRLAAKDQQWDDFGRLLQTHLTLAEHVGVAGTTVEALSGAYILNVAMAITQAELLEQQIPADACQEIEAILSRVETPRAWGRNHLELELFCARSGIDAFYSETGMPLFSPKVLSGIFNNTPAWNFAELHHSMRLTQEGLERELDRIRALVLSLYDAEAGEVITRERKVSAEIERIVEGGGVQLRTVLPSVVRPAMRWLVCERDLIATRLLLRIEAAHKVNGAWPETLNTPDFAELNRDPITAEPFRYALAPDDSHGRSFTLHAPDTPWRRIGGEDYTEPRTPPERESY